MYMFLENMFKVLKVAANNEQQNSLKRYKKTFFKILIGVPACNIVGTLYW